MLTSDSLCPLDPQECGHLADVLRGDPRSTQAVHALHRGACRAFALGDAARPRAALVEVAGLPGEPYGFGSAAALCELLQRLTQWGCVLVAASMARPLGERFTQATGCPVRYHEQVSLMPSRPVPGFMHPNVRMLSSSDLALLERAPSDLHICGYEDQASALSFGYAAGAIHEGAVVSIAHGHAIAAGHAEMGTFTQAEHRGCGLSSAACSLVAHAIQRDGGMPVWNALYDNHASLRVAGKLGFEPRSRNCYVIKQ